MVDLLEAVAGSLLAAMFAEVMLEYSLLLALLRASGISGDG